MLYEPIEILNMETSERCFEIVNVSEVYAQFKREQLEEEMWWREFEHHTVIPTPKTIVPKRIDLVPTTLAACRTIQNQESKRVLTVLLDSGASHTVIHSSCLPVGATPVVMTEKRKLETIAGSFDSTRSVFLRDIVLPEFDKTRHVDGVGAFVFDTPCRYNMILGRDFLSKAGIKLDFQFGVIQWMESMIPMKEISHWQRP